MFTIMYFFWDGLGEATAALINGPMIFPAAETYLSGARAADVYKPGAKAAITIEQ